MANPIQLRIKTNGEDALSAVATVRLDPTNPITLTANDNMQLVFTNAYNNESITSLITTRIADDLLIVNEDGEQIATIDNYYKVQNIQIGTFTDAGFVTYSNIANSNMANNNGSMPTSTDTSYTSLIADSLEASQEGLSTLAEQVKGKFSTLSGHTLLWGSVAAIGLSAIALEREIDHDTNPKSNQDTDNKTESDDYQAQGTAQNSGESNALLALSENTILSSSETIHGELPSAILPSWTTVMTTPIATEPLINSSNDIDTYNATLSLTELLNDSSATLVTFEGRSEDVTSSEASSTADVVTSDGSMSDLTQPLNGIIESNRNVVDAKYHDHTDYIMDSSIINTVI